MTTGIESYLGRVLMTQMVSSQTLGVNFSDNTSIHQQATQAFKANIGEQKQASKETKKKIDDSSMLSEYEMAALMGFCGRKQLARDTGAVSGAPQNKI